ncbi:unnamed protein product [Protopolystoma xenopodis]|uniref:Uncharacterized protein n=1 Tax=Protopolystoma xenopodis TaxID=117903 RepID=A0A3S5A8B3_9PLAT|nr:unnamed protein product [Protopolystoma xenopodis]
MTTPGLRQALLAAASTGGTVLFPFGATAFAFTDSCCRLGTNQAPGCQGGQSHSTCASRRKAQEQERRGQTGDYTEESAETEVSEKDGENVGQENVADSAMRASEKIRVCRSKSPHAKVVRMKAPIGAATCRLPNKTKRRGLFTQTGEKRISSDCLAVATAKKKTPMGNGCILGVGNGLAAPLVAGVSGVRLGLANFDQSLRCPRMETPEKEVITPLIANICRPF